MKIKILRELEEKRVAVIANWKLSKSAISKASTLYTFSKSLEQKGSRLCEAV